MQELPGHDDEVDTVVRFLEVAVAGLAGAREEIDALNVYPVPDGDTGTNLYLTLSAARDAVAGLTDAATVPPGPAEVWAALARGALLGARGNSGVILSQMLGAVAARTGASSPDEPPAAALAAAMADATRASYEAVAAPVEGTILSVAAAASEAAGAALADGGRVGDDDPAADVRRVVTAAADAAREALRRTPEQLAVLAESGVVDAGGRGLVVVLEAAERVVTGRRRVSEPVPLSRHRIPVQGGPGGPGAGGPAGASGDAGPAFEVVYLLRADEAAVAGLRTRLASLGDSLVVVGGAGLWKVHVHVDDAGAAVEAGLAAGVPEDIRITHLATSPVVPGPGQPTGPTGPTGRRVVAVAAGEGLGALFADAGAVVVPGGPGRRPSAGDLMAAVGGCGAAEVVLLPNDADTVATAELAAGELRSRGGPHAVTVAVIPTLSQVEGLAALAVHEPGRALGADVLEMTATARHVRQGAVTVAARRAITMAGACEPGDALGVIAGDFAVVGSDLAAVAREVTERLLAGGGDLVTLVAGAPEPGAGTDGPALAAGLAAYVEETHPTVDVLVYDGGQDRYPLLIAVE